MIIWGSTTKEKRVESTSFYCPACRERTDCDHLKLCTYFTLYFIPLFPTSTLAEFVRCDECEGEFDVKALELTRKQVEALHKPWKCGECGNTNSAREERCLKCRCYRDDDPADLDYEADEED